MTLFLFWLLSCGVALVAGGVLLVIFLRDNVDFALWILDRNPGYAKKMKKKTEEKLHKYYIRVRNWLNTFGGNNPSGSSY